jgi:DNA polymerase III epsilon subunit-like protein
VIIFDTETTGLIGVTSIEQQPRITELGVLKVDDRTLKILFKLDTLVNPGIPLDPKVVKGNGITEEMVKGAKPFIAHLPALIDLFLGERIMVSHNLPFDSGMLALELTRIQKVMHFPWPPEWKCTAEICNELHHRYTSLEELYELFTKKKYKQLHRAMDDAMMLYEVVKALRKQGHI